MGRICHETQEWVEEQIERPVEQFVNELQRTCVEQECNWWCLCCNKWFCFLVWVVVRIVTWVVVTVGKWVARVVCEVVNVVLDVLAFVVNLILSIPVIGGILRTIINWVTEVVWRLISLPEFFASWAGFRPRKKMYFGVVVPPNLAGTPAITDADIQRQVDAAVQIYDQTCNINLIFTGICRTEVPAPAESLIVGCDAGGFFHDWWLAGSWFEFATATCKFKDGFRRLAGIGGELIVVIVDDVTPVNTNGCSFASTHNYVVIEGKPTDQAFVAAHEIGHACWLPHDGDPANLMNGITPAASPVLTAVQIATVRSSKHCVYF
jgi:hypothetical protein